MPFLRFTTNRTLTLQQDRKLKEAAGKVISLFPGKSERALMMHIEDNQIMYYQGDEQDAGRRNYCYSKEQYLLNNPRV